MVYQNRSIGVDLHQGAGLVEMGQREGYSKFHGTKGNAAFQKRMAGIPACNLSFACVVVTALQQAFGHIPQDEIGHLHLIGGDGRARGGL